MALKVKVSQSLSACRRRVRNTSGQVSLMIAMVMTTFILFFAFVVNVGMLVNAKINLQNAADLAAYAGAAVQARQLNDMAHLNYEMRRQYKKFLFRYYVIGNYAQKTFQPTTGPRQWGPVSDTFKVPAVCISFNPNYNNVCQNEVLTGIPIPAKTALDTINDTLAGQLSDLEEIRKSDCLQIGKLNITALVLWLWNTDPSAQHVMDNVSSVPGLPEMVERLKGLVKGLGLIPKELLLQMRVNTLARYLNQKPYRGVTLEKLQSIQSEGDIHARERTIQAFKSAYATLGEHTFSDPEQIQMDELLPESPDGAAMISIKPFGLTFDTYAVNMDPGAGGGTKDCHLRPTPFSTGIKVPLGFYKDPSLLTYYAVRLTAKARVLFSPFGDVTMRAYGSAQPFGSRIGPKITDAEAAKEFGFASDSGGPNGCINAIPAADNPPPCVGLIPNLPVLKNDGTSGGRENGWNHNEVIHSMFDKFAPFTNGPGDTSVQTIDDDARDRAYQAAMVPNPPEKGRYNIPNDLTKDPMFQEFEDPAGGRGTRKRAIWAPVVSSDVITTGGDAKDVIKKEIDKVLNGGTPPTNPIVAGILSTLQGGMEKYVKTLHDGNGEDGESYNVARITDPYKITDPNTGVTRPITHSPATIVLGAPEEARTGFASPKDSDVLNAGRTGYSVKIVPLKALRSPAGLTSDGRSPWSNILPGIDSAIDEDLDSIEH